MSLSEWINKLLHNILQNIINNEKEWTDTTNSQTHKAMRLHFYDILEEVKLQQQIRVCEVLSDGAGWEVA